ncbi:hypothetical protein ACFO3O_17405 [Dokdonia ponticola]|uniref:YtxH domain-containing protein n=1 Tax=Dokdonia ponticola TaxID=2041041 RepID=A0ABV9HZV5_9FLAO
MAQESNIDIKAIAYIAGAGIAGVLLGTFLIAPMMAKTKAKKLEKEKQQAVVAKK